MKDKLKRTGALLLVIVMLALVGLTLYFAVTGSPYFMASMTAMFTLPLLVYSYMFIYRLMKGEDREEKKKDS